MVRLLIDIVTDIFAARQHFKRGNFAFDTKVGNDFSKSNFVLFDLLLGFFDFGDELVVLSFVQLYLGLQLGDFALNTVQTALQCVGFCI